MAVALRTGLSVLTFIGGIKDIFNHHSDAFLNRNLVALTSGEVGTNCSTSPPPPQTGSTLGIGHGLAA